MASFSNKHMQVATSKVNDHLPINMLTEYPTHFILPAKELRQKSQDYEQPVKNNSNIASQYSKCNIVKSEWCCMMPTTSSQCYAKTSPNDCKILHSKKHINQQKLSTKYSSNDCDKLVVSDATVRVAVSTTTATTTFPTRVNYTASKQIDQPFSRSSGAAPTSPQRPAFRVNYRKIKCKTNKHHGLLPLFTAFCFHSLQMILTILATAPFSKKLLSHRSSPATSKTPKQKIQCQAMTAKASVRTRFRILPSLGATSFLTLLTFVCFETVLLSTVSNCAKTFYMHWNTSNSIFRIDNTDHIIDVNKGNLAFEFDQVHIICPVYEPGTFENETEKYIIYNVSKVEYETCRITNADPRVIAICDKPQKLMFFTITFRPFTPQPGGLEFLPGNDYYFISTSSKDDLYRRIGGRCSTNNMKVVFKVCCAPEEKNKTSSSSSTTSSSGSSGGSTGDGNTSTDNGDIGLHVDINSGTNVNQHHMNNINAIGGAGIMNTGNNNGIQLKPINGPTGTSINTNIDQFNRIPIQTNGINIMGNNNIGGMGHGSHGGNGIMLAPGHHGGINLIPTVGGGGGGILQYPSHHPGQTGIRINNVPSQHYPIHKNQHNNNNNNNNNDDHYDKHPNEVVKNEELTYNSGSSSIHQQCILKLSLTKLHSIASALKLHLGSIVTGASSSIFHRSSYSRSSFRLCEITFINENIKNIFNRLVDFDIADRIVNLLDCRQFITNTKVYKISLNYTPIILLLLIYIVTVIHFGFAFILNILKIFTKNITNLFKKKTTTSYSNNTEKIPLEYLDENLQELR